MGYLLIGLVIGIVVDRYVLPILDTLMEIMNYKASEVCTEIKINTNLKSIEYQEIADQNSNQLSPAIGFLGKGEDDGYYIDDDDEDDGDSGRLKIGFIK